MVRVCGALPRAVAPGLSTSRFASVAGRLAVPGRYSVCQTGRAASPQTGPGSRVTAPERRGVRSRQVWQVFEGGWQCRMWSLVVECSWSHVPGRLGWHLRGLPHGSTRGHDGQGGRPVLHVGPPALPIPCEGLARQRHSGFTLSRP